MLHRIDICSDVGSVSSVSTDKGGDIGSDTGDKGDKGSDKPPLLSCLSPEQQDNLINTIHTHLSTPSHWLRANLLRLLQRLPDPMLNKDTKKTAPIATLCLQVH